MPFLPPPPDEITIYARRPVRYSAADGSVTYEGDVVVRYGATKVTADRVVLFRTQKRAFAEGHVTLVDPDGTAQAERLGFSWDPAKRSGSGEGVTVRVGGVLFRAHDATFLPGKWTLHGVEATTFLLGRPVLSVTSDLVTADPKQSAYIHQPRVSLLGKFIAEIPTQRPSLSPAIPGLHYPSPMYKLKRGFGVSWAGGILAGHDATFFFNAHAFENAKPSAFALYTRSFVPVQKATQIVAPRTDFAERFYFGYLDDVVVQSPEAEARFLRATKASLSGGGQLNGSISDRDRGTRYSKVEAVYERGRSSDGYGVLGQLRLQGIQREDDGMKGRASLTGSFGLPSFRLGPGLTTLSRLDSNLYVGSTLFGWARGLAGVSYAPKAWLRLSGGVFTSFEGGNPQFEIDPLYSKDGLQFRADVVNGGLRVSFLSKRDFRRGDYDNEFAVVQEIGSFEASFVSRGYPRDRRIGLTLRFQSLSDVVKRRGVTSPQEGTKNVP